MMGDRTQVGTFAPADLLGPLNETERKHAPKELYVSGDLSLLQSGARISIVGSRKASAKGLAYTRELARRLAEQEIIVLSGLAEGIDTAAHTAAIEHDGRTIAVLGTPLDRYFPLQNRALQEKIMREHLAISQFPSGYPSRPGNFPIRNRTMALIADVTIIIEAGEKSGTIHQGWEAIRLGRLLYIAKPLFEAGLKWVSEMQRYGAQPFSEDDLELLLEFLPPRGCRVAGLTP